jgi:hypothetical protein
VQYSLVILIKFENQGVFQMFMNVDSQLRYYTLIRELIHDVNLATGSLPRYNALLDGDLKEYFETPHVKAHLENQGFVSHKNDNKQTDRIALNQPIDWLTLDRWMSLENLYIHELLSETIFWWKSG